MSNKEFGQFFTPKIIADFMVDLISKPKNAKILEPCAGEGVFLTALTEKGYTNIDAFEIDNKLINRSSVNITYLDYLSVKSPQKYDVIIGNPPYVRWKNIPACMKENIQKNLTICDNINGLADLLYAFIYLSVDRLNKNGELIFITPLFWTSTLYSQFLRKFLAKNGNIDIFISFNEMRIFKNVSSSIIIFKFVKENDDRQAKVIRIQSKNLLTLDHLNQVNKCIELLKKMPYISENEYEAYLHNQNKNGNPWIFLPPRIEPIIERIEKKCTENAPIIIENSGKGKKYLLSSLLDRNDLEEYGIDMKLCNIVQYGKKKYYNINSTNLFQSDNINIKSIHRYIKLGDVAEIGNGLVSGLDEAFRIDNSDLLNDQENQYLVKVVKAKNLDRYVISGYTNYLFLNNLDSEPNSEKLPRITKQLQNYLDPLKKRYSYNKDIPYWHWVFLRNYELIKNNKEKIIVPCKERVDKRQYIRFALAIGDYLATQDTTVIVKNSFIKEDIRYLLAILNSKLTFQWIQYKGLVRGGVFEFSEKPLSIIPIRLIDWSNKEEILIHDNIVKEINSIIHNGITSKKIENIEKNVSLLYNVNF